MTRDVTEKANFAMSELMKEVREVAEDMAQLRHEIAMGISPKATQRAAQIKRILTDTEKREREMFKALGMPYKPKRKTGPIDQRFLYRGVLDWIWFVSVFSIAVVLAFPVLRWRFLDWLGAMPPRLANYSEKLLTDGQALATEALELAAGIWRELKWSLW